MKKLAIGDKLYYYNSTHIWSMVQYGEYEIVGETPKFWKLNNGYLCNKSTLIIRGSDRKLQEKKNKKLDKELIRQQLLSDIEDKANELRKIKKEIWKNGDIKALEELLKAFDNVIKKREES